MEALQKSWKKVKKEKAQKGDISFQIGTPQYEETT